MFAVKRETGRGSQAVQRHRAERVLRSACRSGAAPLKDQIACFQWQQRRLTVSTTVGVLLNDGIVVANRARRVSGPRTSSCNSLRRMSTRGKSSLVRGGKLGLPTLWCQCPGFSQSTYSGRRPLPMRPVPGLRNGRCSSLCPYTELDEPLLHVPGDARIALVWLFCIHGPALLLCIAVMSSACGPRLYPHRLLLLPPCQLLGSALGLGVGPLLFPPCRSARRPLLRLGLFPKTLRLLYRHRQLAVGGGNSPLRFMRWNHCAAR